MFYVCCTLLYVHSSIAIILMGKRELVALLNLSSWCLVMFERLFLAVPRGCLRFVIVVFPEQSHLLFLSPPVNGTAFVDFLCFFCLVFAMPLYPSVNMCLVVTCCGRAGLLAPVCGVLL